MSNRKRMATGKEIKRLRGKDVSAVKAAELIGVSVDRLRKWEERDADPSDTGDIQKVETYFGVTLSELENLPEFEFVKKPSTKQRSSTKEAELQAQLIENQQVLIESQKKCIKLLEERQQSETRLIQVEETLKIIVGILKGLALPASHNTSYDPSDMEEVAIGSRTVKTESKSTDQTSGRKQGKVST